MPKKVLIVGGVAGGSSVAARLRRLDEQAEIIIFERGKNISYANCGIPYYIGDVIKERDDLVVVSKRQFTKMFKAEVRTESEVIEIDRTAKKIKVKDLTNNYIYEEAYDKLVLSPGGQPIRPPIDGVNDSRVFTLRSLEDMDAIKTFINDKKPKKAVVVGAGFIGLEMAENLTHLGIKVAIVELAGQVMNLLDFEMAAVIHQHLHHKNIELHLKDAVEKFTEGKELLEVKLKSGRNLETDMVLLNVGIKPEVDLAKNAGLKVGAKGGLVVNDKMETADPNIYALGDVIEIKDSVFGLPALIPLANSANKQGRLVADNINGANRVYKGTPGTAIAKVFDLTVAITGGSEKQLKKQGVKYSKVYLNPASHAGYYPDAFPMFFKLLYEVPSGRLLGAQIVGAEGVDKRIDVISAMLQQKQTVFDLAELELAYAPPYSSAKDPVNLAAMVAINQMEGKSQVIYWDELAAAKERGALLIDVRTPMEFDLGQIEGAKNIPLVKIRESLSEIPKDREIIVYCNQGKTSYFALSLLRNLGYEKVYSLSGGYKLYRLTTLKQENLGVFDDVYVDKAENINMVNTKTEFILDASGLQCPGPIIKVAQVMKEHRIGEVLEVIATDPGFKYDIGAWCERTGNKLLSVEAIEGGKIVAHIQKGAPMSGASMPSSGNDKTLVVFSNDLGKAIASFIIANGAASMGRKVTMFFTFWGLNILRDPKAPKVKKGLLDKMFGLMMPKGSKKLKLSQMNMLGIGAKMIRFVMGQKKVDSLEELMASAKAQGVKLIACQMSMDVMGIKKEELLTGVEVAGVASYLSAAESADTNLFI